ncbi:hypothetical protein M0802_015138 [Mischocyttarus mexicanus]|nr:hypothetical protein M0802_015138 [Mischocyttarus mexicanus]
MSMKFPYGALEEDVVSQRKVFGSGGRRSTLERRNLS